MLYSCISSSGFFVVSDIFSSVQSLSLVRLFATPWITACQASLSITNSRSSLRLAYTIIPSTNNGSFTLLPVVTSFTSTSCLIALLRIFRATVNRSGNSGHLRLVLEFRESDISSLIKMFSSVQLLSRVELFATPWIAACQASLSITNSRSSLRLTSTESWCHPAI